MCMHANDNDNVIIIDAMGDEFVNACPCPCPCGSVRVCGVYIFPMVCCFIIVHCSVEEEIII